MDDKKARLLDLLNKLAKIEPKLYNNCSWIAIGAEHDEALRDLERAFPELVLKDHPDGYGCELTVPALLATITYTLCGERLCFHVDPDTFDTAGFGWYENE